MNSHQDHQLSAPACQLSQVGTAGTNSILTQAVSGLEDKDIGILEEELGFYAQTGLIGIRMSNLLGELRELSMADAA